MATFGSAALRAGLIGFVGCWVGCGGQSTVERDGGTPDAGSDAQDASTGGSGGDSGTDADSGEAAECITFLGACKGDLLCCSGAECQGEGCGIDPGCAHPGAACDAVITCCEGDPCGADGTCPLVSCHGPGKSCGSGAAPPCCPGLACDSGGSCFDPTPCSLAGDACGKGCCAGLTCDGSGVCAGTVACLPGSGDCFSCISASCCGQLAQCQSVAKCDVQLACLSSCTTDGTWFTKCKDNCGSTGVLLEAVRACANTQCVASCGPP